MNLPLNRSAAIGQQFIDLSPELTVAIVRTIEAGWQVALDRREINMAADEVTITECLRDAMRVALVSNGFPWRKTMIIAPGTESRSRPGMTAPDGRTDIPIFLTPVFARSGEHDPHGIIECKRVAEGDAALAREYVVEGIDRFRSGKYSNNHSRGFMIGYVLRGSGQGVVNGINSYLAGRSRSAEMLSPDTIHDFAVSWHSQHSRAGIVTVISLHHAMLLVSGNAGTVVAESAEDRQETPT